MGGLYSVFTTPHALNVFRLDLSGDDFYVDDYCNVSIQYSQVQAREMYLVGIPTKYVLSLVLVPMISMLIVIVMLVFSIHRPLL